MSLTPVSQPGIMSPPPPPPPRCAPGLAIRKPKISPYDRKSHLEAKDPYSHLAERPSAELQGTWSVIDPDEIYESRVWDTRWESEEQARSKARSEGRGLSQSRSGTPNIWSNWPNDDTKDGCATFNQDAQSDWKIRPESVNSRVDGRFENRELDVDDAVREQFGHIRDILKDDKKPRSLFEQRNSSILIHKNASQIQNIIGGKVISVLEQKADNRAELRDRHGNYVDGINRGLMKKRYEEEWRKRIDDRDEQMTHAMKVKRAWDSLPPEEKARRNERAGRNERLVDALGAGLENLTLDIFTCEAIPDVYIRRVSAQEVKRWAETQSSRPGLAAQSRIGDVFQPVSDFDESSMLSNPVSNTRFCRKRRYPSEVVESIEQGSKRSIPNVAGLHIRSRESTSSRHRSHTPQGLSTGPTVRETGRRSIPPSLVTPTITTIATVSSTRETTPFLVEETPDLAPLKDIEDELPIFSSNREGIDSFDITKAASSKRGRIVLVRLHEPVQFSSSMVAERLFGGVVQEIQYFPADRMAIVIFVYPFEAAAIVRHVQCMRRNDGFNYRRLQIDVEWYKGLENSSVYPTQPCILALNTSSQKATRCLLITGIPMSFTAQTLSLHLRREFCFILVKVSLVPQRKARRIVEVNEGNTAILDLAGIRDAFSVKRRIEDEGLRGLEGIGVEWVHDPADRGGEKMRYCDCVYCKA